MSTKTKKAAKTTVPEGFRFTKTIGPETMHFVIAMTEEINKRVAIPLAVQDVLAAALTEGLLKYVKLYDLSGWNEQTMD